MVAIDVSRSEKASEEASSGVEAGKRGAHNDTRKSSLTRAVVALSSSRES